MKVDKNNYQQFLIHLDNKNKPVLNTDNLFSKEMSYSKYHKIIENKYKKCINESGYCSECVINDPLTMMNQINHPNIYFDKDYSPKKCIVSRIKNQIPFKTITINKSINKIQDILDIIEEFPIEQNTNYNIDLKLFHSIKEPLHKLNQMVGLKDFKVSILEQLIYFIQKLHLNNNNSGDFMHTVLYGPPGTGKTEIAQIIGEIFCNLDILKNKKFTKVTRSDLIAGYLGQTAMKTKEVIEKSLGGVLFIDEVYALGNSEKRDSFSKECIDTLCESLSFHKKDLMVIIAGYEKDINNCFFSYNEGLESRFAWRLNINKYNGEELYEIFYKKICDIEWKYEGIKEELQKWFIDNIDSFPHYGRDIEMLLLKVKISHSKRIFGKSNDLKKKINIDDVKNGYEKYILNNNQSNIDTKKFKNHLLNTLYC